MRAKSDEPAQQRDDALPPKRPPAPNLERRQPAHSSVTTELDLIFNPVVGREGINASSFPRPPNVVQSTWGQREVVTKIVIAGSAAHTSAAVDTAGNRDSERKNRHCLRGSTRIAPAM
jgi:hypothetical protein